MGKAARPDDAEARCAVLIEEINKILRCPESWRKSDIISRLNYAVEKAEPPLDVLASAPEEKEPPA